MTGLFRILGAAVAVAVAARREEVVAARWEVRGARGTLANVAGQVLEAR